MTAYEELKEMFVSEIARKRMKGDERDVKEIIKEIKDEFMKRVDKHFEIIKRQLEEKYSLIKERKMTIGERIQQLRMDKNLTQSELAKELGVKRETVNQWENGTRDLKTGYTIKLANYFNETCDYILKGINESDEAWKKEWNLK